MNALDKSITINYLSLLGIRVRVSIWIVWEMQAEQLVWVSGVRLNQTLSALGISACLTFNRNGGCDSSEGQLSLVKA